MGPDETTEAATDTQPTADAAPQPQAGADPAAAAPPAAAAMTGAPAAQPQPAQAPAVPSPAAQVVAHQSRLGQIAMAAMGKQVSYQADPKTGVVTPVVQQRSFSDFARNLVGGLLLGGAIGAKAGAATGSPLAAGVAGAQGVQEQGQQQDQQARSQAEQGMKDQQDANADNDQDALRKAQIAHANLTTLQLNQAIQRQGYEDHDKLAKSGQANVKPYVDAGLKPLFEDIPESQMQQTIKSYPGASALDWTHTGMITGADLSKATGMDVEQTGEHPVEGPDGQTHYEATFTAFDPKGEVPLSGQTIDQWKQDGFLKSLGANAQDVLKPDMQMPAQQYIALKNQHEKFQLQTETARQQTQKVAMDKAKLDSENALAAQRRAAAGASDARASRAGRAAQTGTAGDAASKLPNGPNKPNLGDTSSNEVSRIGDNVIAGYSTLDDAGRGMGKEAAQFRRQVQDYILSKSPNQQYDFEGQKAESKEFNSIPVRTKMTANETLTGRDGKSGLLKDLSDAAHQAGLTSLPSLNDAQAWTRIQSGSAAGVKAHQLATDVAEQYGSIFAQGGATSDAKIKLGQENFPKNFNTAQTDEAVNAARVALADRMRVYADHNRFIRTHYGAAIPVRIQDDKGRSGTTTMDKVDDYLAKNPNWKRLN